MTQIDTLEEYQLVLVLANKTLSSYPLEALDASEGQNPLARRPKKIQGHTNFFKVGIGLGRHLVCSVKTSALSTTIKVFEGDWQAFFRNGSIADGCLARYQTRR